MTKWRNDYLNPRILETQQDVDEVNEIEIREKYKTRWKIGDTCYRKKFKLRTNGKWIDEE